MNGKAQCLCYSLSFLVLEDSLLSHLECSYIALLCTEPHHELPKIIVSSTTNTNTLSSALKDSLLSHLEPKNAVT